MSTLRKNVSGQYVYFGMVVAATGAAYGGTAGSITIQVAKDNAASGVGAGTMSSDGSGQFHYAPTQGETNGTSLGFFFTQATCIPVHFAIFTTAADPTNATTGGLTNLDAAITTRMATYTQPTGFLAATFPSGTVANTTNITAGTITTVTNLTNAPTAGDFTATMKTSAQTAADAAVTANALVLEIEADTDTLTGFITVAPPTANANADALLARNIAGGSSSGRIVTDALRFLRNKWSVSGTTLTVTQEDDTTSAWTATVSTDAAALPITGSDPA